VWPAGHGLEAPEGWGPLAGRAVRSESLAIGTVCLSFNVSIFKGFGGSQAPAQTREAFATRETAALSLLRPAAVCSVGAAVADEPFRHAGV
jgi:hypothetical protein